MKERISSIIERPPLGELIGGRTQNTESERNRPPPTTGVGSTTFSTDGEVNWPEEKIERVRVNDELFCVEPEDDWVLPSDRENPRFKRRLWWWWGLEERTDGGGGERKLVGRWRHLFKKGCKIGKWDVARNDLQAFSVLILIQKVLEEVWCDMSICCSCT
ncbi:hypothetical protein AVEN_108438-1 [Araneus ventricosus]|uniref:Uncharacterized protein n=1 Tax=Araneus ventricosus TaxID=182803 RepID=A0A4Y2MAJ6_ARAVE|nr:hypothetical protein AVEN_108438-1 [Araneus ventricosus]